MAHYDPDELADIARDEARAAAEEDRASYLEAASLRVTHATTALRDAATQLRECELLGLNPDEEGEFHRLAEIADGYANLACFLIEDVDKFRPDPPSVLGPAPIHPSVLEADDTDHPF